MVVDGSSLINRAMESLQEYLLYVSSLREMEEQIRTQLHVACNPAERCECLSGQSLSTNTVKG
jgi:hypothetical protein